MMLKVWPTFEEPGNSPHESSALLGSQWLVLPSGCPFMRPHFSEGRAQVKGWRGVHLCRTLLPCHPGPWQGSHPGPEERVEVGEGGGCPAFPAARDPAPRRPQGCSSPSPEWL